jgi:putative ABC transport system ATP-binding protein
MPLLDVKNLSYCYPGEHSIVFPDFKVEENGHTLIYGPSGAGKTTLLHLLSGLKTIQNGVIRINGQDLSQLKPKELDRFRAKHLSIVFQRSFFISSLNVIENIMLPSGFADIENTRGKAEELLDRFGIADRKNKSIGSLSVGEQQRVSIARAFLNHPQIVIADEPTSALDDQNCDKVLDMMMSVSRDFGSTFIVVSHDMRIKERFEQNIELK